MYICILCHVFLDRIVVFDINTILNIRTCCIHTYIHTSIIVHTYTYIAMNIDLRWWFYARNSWRARVSKTSDERQTVKQRARVGLLRVVDAKHICTPFPSITWSVPCLWLIFFSVTHFNNWMVLTLCMHVKNGKKV